MTVKKYCPGCGNEIIDEDIEFCTECGCSLTGKFNKIDNSSNGFFDNLIDKTSFSIIVFAFIIFGVFLFIGSLIWSSFMTNGIIDLITYCILTIAFAIFFAGLFVGYFGCKDKSYVIPNFSVFMGSIYAVILTIFGLVFTFSMGLISVLSSVFSSGSSGSSSSLSSSAPLSPSYSSGMSQPTVSTSTSALDLKTVFEVIVFILAIPIAAYFGVYLGYYLKENI